MQMVDRFISKPQNAKYLSNRQHFQLLTVASLYIAVKTNEPVDFPSSKIAEMCAGTYSANDIEVMELSILQDLEWRISTTTISQMSHNILSLLLPYVHIEESTWLHVLDEVEFQAQQAARDYYLLTQCPPSVVAIAAILNAFGQVDLQLGEQVFDSMRLVLCDLFPSPREILRSKQRLTHLLETNEPMKDDLGAFEFLIALSEPSTASSHQVPSEEHWNDSPGSRRVSVNM